MYNCRVCTICSVVPCAGRFIRAGQLASSVGALEPIYGVQNMCRGIRTTHVVRDTHTTVSGLRSHNPQKTSPEEADNPNHTPKTPPTNTQTHTHTFTTMASTRAYGANKPVKKVCWQRGARERGVGGNLHRMCGCAPEPTLEITYTYTNNSVQS